MAVLKKRKKVVTKKITKKRGVKASVKARKPLSEHPYKHGKIPANWKTGNHDGASGSYIGNM